ncbi:M14 family metallopeptidase [Sinomicrobium soli]|uniref:M14 family metallopeptidase n=1 Tax=Sinomicrobium sp. N-1-3-6 TaxID=2219864 RepID=UPI001374C3BE|nr:M14 family metallocarboxypeptidase [Sinomicrobium sp. N-1-3-6]
MKKLIILILLCTGPSCSAQLFNPQSKKITARYFPEMEADIHTPAFRKKRGFTNYKEMMSFLAPLVKQHQKIIHLSYIGKSQKGHPIPLLLISNPDSKEEKTRVWIQAGIHGNEPASTEGVLFLIGQLLENPEYTALLDRVEIGIIPMANIDGSNRQLRPAANGLDLNRDQTKLMVPESVVLKQAFTDFNAQVALDFHEFRPYRRDYLQMGTFGLTNAYDVMFLYSGNLNVPEPLRKYTEHTFVKGTETLLREKGLTTHAYFTSSDYQGYTVFNQGSVNARSSATSYALANCISTLVEVRGIGLGRTSFKRRTMTTFLIALSYIKTAAENGNAVREVLAASVLQRKEGRAVIKSKRTVSRSPLAFIDLHTEKKTEETVILRDALQSSPLLDRPLPRAYILLPSQEKIVEKLRVLGVEVEISDKAKEVSVEAYHITEYYRAAQKYEGTRRQTVKTRLFPKTITLPEGSFFVYTDQKNIGLAVETLEPEASNSFVSYNLIPAGKGEELPVYRYNSNIKP